MARPLLVDRDEERAALRDLAATGRKQLATLSGQGWANEVDNAVYLYVSAAGFTTEMQQFAASNGRILLRTLDDLYPDA